MKKICSILLCVICLAGLPAQIKAASTPTKPYNWYCRHVHDGTQPPCDAGMQFISQYGGYYIDANNSDPAAEEKVIYLTFDAGYENGNVAKVLDAMRAENVPGAFFILENVAKRNPELVKRMAAEGHLVCNHTASHRDMTKCHDAAGFAAELAKMEQICLEETGVTMAKYYRPPEGRFSEENLQFASDAGYKTVFWSFGYMDWDNERQMSAEDALEKILSGVHNGEVLLLHPTSATNAAIMPALIRELRARGFRFGTLDELTGQNG
ncbi:MAG: delta-lactam-biosynthetic de-N-acetylase [Ruminococcaceae bacterium]|nr:delta-lactam-biosynthetic de-N-acetylase [Oscillospiraceae bacterium]